MTDPILYLSMLLGLGGVYVLISSFHDDDDGDDDGEKYFYNFEYTYFTLTWSGLCINLFLSWRKDGDDVEKYIYNLEYTYLAR